MSKLNKIRNKAMEAVKSSTSAVKDSGSKLASSVVAMSAEDVASKFTQFYSEMANRFLGAQVTIYDKALDAEYIESKIGGAYHRLFDEGHDLFDAWEKVRNASSDDTFVQEVIGYTSALTKDIVTKMGLPIKSMDKEAFDLLVDKLSIIPGVDRAYLYDLLTVNAAELTASALSAVGLFMAFKSEDYEKLSEILGTMGISSIMAANPVMGIVTLVVAGYSYKKSQLKRDKLAVGAGVSAMAFAIFAILGLPFLVELVLVMLASSYAKKNLFENEELRTKLLERFDEVNPGSLFGAVQDFAKDLSRNSQIKLSKIS